VNWAWQEQISYNAHTCMWNTRPQCWQSATGINCINTQTSSKCQCTFQQHNKCTYHWVKQWNFNSQKTTLQHDLNQKRKRKQNEMKRKSYKKLIRRWDSERKLFYNDIVHTLQNTIDWCKKSATDRRSYVLESRFTKFSEIRQCNGHHKFSYQSKTHMQLSISD